jgi:hypothetical protein
MQFLPFVNRRNLERVLASLALLISVITVVRLWQAISVYQPIWLFPALYFLEIIVVSILGWLAIVPTKELSAGQIAIAWSVVGVIIGFSILAMFSVGIFFLPIALLFALAALFAERRHLHLIPVHLLLCALAGLAQGAAIWAIASLH